MGATSASPPVARRYSSRDLPSRIDARRAACRHHARDERGTRQDNRGRHERRDIGRHAEEETGKRVSQQQRARDAQHRAEAGEAHAQATTPASTRAEGGAPRSRMRRVGVGVAPVLVVIASVAPLNQLTDGRETAVGLAHAGCKLRRDAVIAEIDEVVDGGWSYPRSRYALASGL